jgi:hypothetical protein
MDKAAWRASILEGELMVAHQGWDVVEEKLLSLAAKLAATDQQWVTTEEQCEHLVHELCLTITGAPP